MLKYSKIKIINSWTLQLLIRSNCVLLTDIYPVYPASFSPINYSGVLLSPLLPFKMHFLALDLFFNGYLLCVCCLRCYSSRQCEDDYYPNIIISIIPKLVSNYTGVGASVLGSPGLYPQRGNPTQPMTHTTDPVMTITSGPGTSPGLEDRQVCQQVLVSQGNGNLRNLRGTVFTVPVTSN